MSASSTTPAWLLQSEVGLCPCACVGKRRKGRIIEKTTSGIAALLRQTLFSDDIADERGLLQRLDARVKVVSLLGLLVVAAFVRHIPVLLAMYAATLALAAASKLRLSFFVKRVWLFIPLFTGIVVLPATLNVVTRGDIVVPLGTWFGHHLGLTRQGLWSAGLVVTRVATSTSLVVLLTITTPWAKLLASLRALRAPRLLILVLGMAYRYLFHLLNAVSDMYVARRARTVTAATDTTSGRLLVGSSAGALLGKAQALSDEVHMAMIARGYEGDARSLDTFRLRLVDIEFVLACIAGAVATVGFDRLLGR
ncbi:MAG: cobalt/nickel transport system permease protein [Actinomycetota bacterium]|nr:cobalt/nickel transport system permease protein [Actinomycetota bacterium]